MIRDYKQEQLINILREEYSVNVSSMKRLGGYYDRNYLVTDIQIPPHKYILKISNYQEDEELLKLQTHILSQMKYLKADLCHFPELVLTNQSQQMVKIQEDGKANYIRLLKYVQGFEMTYIKNLPEQIFIEIGIIAGKVVNFFKEITEHQHIQQLLKVVNMQQYLENLWTFPQLYDQTIEYFEGETLNEVKKARAIFDQIAPILKMMPKQLIHNDICLTNVLAKHDKEKEYVLSGIIDFSSACYCEPIVELAIVAAEINLDEAQYLKTMLLVIRGFCSIRKLTEKEAQVLFPLIKCRLAFICMTTLREISTKNNKSDYMMTSMERQKTYLHYISKEWIEDEFRKELGKITD